MDMETNENGNSIHQNLWDANTFLRGKFIEINAYIDACVWSLKRGLGAEEPICRAAVETQT